MIFKKTVLVSCKKEIMLKVKVDIIFRTIQNLAEEGKSLMLLVAKMLSNATLQIQIFLIGTICSCFFFNGIQFKIKVKIFSISLDLKSCRGKKFDAHSCQEVVQCNSTDS